MMGQTLRLVQFITEAGKRAVGVPAVDGEKIMLLSETASVYELAQVALAQGATLAQTALARVGLQSESYDRVAAEQRLLPPLDHPDPMHCLVTGTGVTHRQKAKSVDEKSDAPAARKETSARPKSDAARLYEAGLEGGRPPAGTAGTQPEWFYKGDGSCMVGSERHLVIPDFSIHCGEEAEVVGLYIVNSEGAPRRLGYALGNDLSDHPMEQQNCLLLGHSKLRSCGVGPELLTGPLPASVEGTSRILRGGNVLWEKQVRSGEANMTHTLANLEHHHFKYAMFCRPGTVHVHYFGAMGLSFVDGLHAEPGDIFEIAIAQFGRPLRNSLTVTASAVAVVSSL